MKKALAITLACVMAAGVLGGCSGKGGEKTTEGEQGETVKPQQKLKRERKPRVLLPARKPLSTIMTG